MTSPWCWLAAAVASRFSTGCPSSVACGARSSDPIRNSSRRRRIICREYDPCSQHRTPIRLPQVSNRAAAVEDKRALIRAAAVRTFAKKGYHACRVSDIAEEAGVAYGLVYHYFGSKEAVLETVFRETWQLMLTAIQAVEELGEPAPEQIRKVAAMVLRTWRDDPDLVRV